MKKKNLFFFFLICFAYFCYGNNSNVRFRHLSVEDGLSQSTIQVIYQDKFGFIWIGTVDGLNRFDGHEFKTYYSFPDNKESLLSNNVFSIYSDTTNRLWIGTKKGLCLYDYVTDKFIQKEHWPDVTITKIIEYPKGTLIFGSYEGIYTLQISSDSLERIVADSKITQAIRNDRFILTQEKQLIVKSQDKLGLLNLEDKKISLFEDRNNSLDGSEIRSLKQDPSGRIWIGTNKGLYFTHIQGIGSPLDVISFASVKPKNSIATHATIINLFCSDDDKLWIGMENGGIELLDLQSLNSGNVSVESIKNIPGDITSISNNSINSIYQDIQNNLWIGTFSGINFYHPSMQEFRHIKNVPGSSFGGLSNNHVNAVYCYDDFVLIGTEGGLDVLDQNTNNITPLYSTKTDAGNTSGAVLEIIKDRKDRFWIGTWERGVGYFSKNQLSNVSGPIRLLSHPNLQMKNVFALYETAEGNILIGSMGSGLTVFNPQTEEITELIHDSRDPSSISSNHLRDIIGTRRGEIWVSTYSAVDVFNAKMEKIREHDYNPDDTGSINDNGAIVMFEDSRENVWLGTESGLNVFLREKECFKSYTEKDGLINNTIKAIVEDSYGNLWLSTNKGIAKFVSGVEIPSQPTFENFDNNDGLQSNEFNRRAATIDENGDMFFGGIKGLSVFNQDRLEFPLKIPEILVQDLYLNNNRVLPNDKHGAISKNILESDRVIVKPEFSVISIKYVLLNYRNPSKISYQYKLDGFDEDWNNAGDRTQATYTNLRAGEYLFRVRTTDVNTDGTLPETSLSLVILPPWYKTKWAIAVYVVLITFIVFILRMSIRERIKLQHQLQIKEIEREKVSQVNQMKSQFFTNISHEFRTPLTLIITPLEKILADFNLKPQLAQHLKNIHRNTKRLLRLINQLLDISRMESDHLALKVSEGNLVGFVGEIVSLFGYLATKKAIKYDFNCNQKQFTAYFDADKIEKILYNLLSNAFKYTKEGEISIELVIHQDGSQKGHFELKVQDSGAGISSEQLSKIFDPFYRITGSETDDVQGSGIGLPLIKGLVNVYHGEIHVDSTAGVGTEFTICLPYESQFFKQTEISTTAIGDLSATIDPYDIDEEISLDDPVNEANGANGEDKKLVLIVEDNDELRVQLKGLLMPAYHVMEAVNGEDGLKRALETPPSLIISDIRMPVKAGISLCKDLKSNELTSHIPIILLTAKTETHDQVAGLETGADAYMLKPFNTKILESTIKNLIESRNVLRKKFRKSVVIQPEEIAITSVDEKFLQKALGLVNKNLSDSEFNVEKFSREIGMSRTYLHHKLVSLTDLSPSAFIRTLRIKRAAELLTKGQLTVSEILFEVGIRSRSYFNKIFREEFKVSPLEYVNIYQKSLKNSEEQ